MQPILPTGKYNDLFTVIYLMCLYPTYDIPPVCIYMWYCTVAREIIGASLSEPHINGTAMRAIYGICIYVYMYICMVRPSSARRFIDSVAVRISRSGDYLLSPTLCHTSEQQSQCTASIGDIMNIVLLYIQTSSD